MHKLWLSVGMIGYLAIGQAQNVTPAPGSTSAEGGATESYGDIATLSQQIALSERKLQAVQLQSNLEALQQQQMRGGFSFKVQHIEGFNDSLYAVLVDENGVLYHVEPGEVFADHYRATLIRPSAVGVLDLTSNRFYTVPFVMGSDAIIANSDAQTHSTPMTSNSSSPKIGSSA